MTHAEALHAHRLPVETPDCSGRLELLSATADRHHGTGLADRVVAVYQCRACGRRVSLGRRADPVAQTVELAHDVLNDYLPPPRRLVHELAEIYRTDFAPIDPS